MKLSGRNFIAALLLLAFLSPSLQAKPIPSDWSIVQNLRIGSNIVVATKNGERFDGELKHVDADSLMMLVRVSQSSRQAIELRREDISEIRKPKSRVLAAALGAGIGFGIGITIGAIVDARHPYSDDPGLGKVLFGALGTGGGLAVGSGLRLKGKKIYVAP